MRMTVHTDCDSGAFSHGPLLDDGFLVAGPQCPATALQLRPDLAVCFWEQSGNTPEEIRMEFDTEVLRFSFVLQGESVSTADGQEDFDRSRGSVEIRHFREEATMLHLRPGSVHRWVDIVLQPAFLRIALGNETDRLPERLRNVLTEPPQTMPCLGRSMTPDQFVAATQLANCPFNDAARIMYLKSKTLELLSHVLALRPADSQETRFSSYEIGCLNKARSVLVRDLESPPSLRDLARLVGVSETKLKRGFKALFGQTVYGYYRAYRMDHARRLLMESDASVSQVATAIGYTNISHFSAAFKTHHGIKPSALLRTAHTGRGPLSFQTT